MDRVCIHNGVKTGCCPLSADDVLSPDLVSVEQAGDLIAIRIAFGRTVSQCDRLISCLDGDSSGNAGNNQWLLLRRIRNRQRTILYTELSGSLEFFPAEQLGVVHVVDYTGCNLVVNGADVGDAAAGIAEYDPVGDTLLISDLGHICSRIHCKWRPVERFAGTGCLHNNARDYRNRSRYKGIYGNLTVFSVYLIKRRHVHVLNSVIHIDMDCVSVDHSIKIRAAVTGNDVRPRDPVSGQKPFCLVAVGVAQLASQIGGIENLIFTLCIYGSGDTAHSQILSVGGFRDRQCTIQHPETVKGIQILLAEQQNVIHIVDCIRSDNILCRTDVGDAVAGIAEDDPVVVSVFVGNQGDILTGRHLQRITVKLLLGAGSLHDRSRRGKGLGCGHHGTLAEISAFRVVLIRVLVINLFAAFVAAAAIVLV